MDKRIKAGKFKAQCLQIMEEVKRTRKRIVITKRDIPIAKLVPIDEKRGRIVGCLKGSIHIKGDIIGPLDEEWDANS